MKTVKMAVGAPGHVPVPSGCSMAADCFHCPYRDCKAIANELTGGQVTYEEALNRGLKRQAVRLYLTGYMAREVAAIMKEPAVKVGKWIWEARKAGICL